jgi:hypothetical protein
MKWKDFNMTCVYYIDGKSFITENYNKIHWKEISSLDENTPAYENLKTGKKLWSLKGHLWHRLTGPAIILSDGSEDYYLNDKLYENIHDWL